MTDREFWQAIRRHLLGIVAAIERSQLGEQDSMPAIKKMSTAEQIMEMGKKAAVFVKEHPEVIRHGKYEI